MKQLYIIVLLSIVVVACGKKTQNMAIGNETLKEAKESKTQQTEELLHQLHDSILKQTKTIKALESQVNHFNSRLIQIEGALKQNSVKKAKSSEVESASISTKDNRKLYLNKKPVGSEEMAESITPILAHCIEQFGPDRCMFESNFPVDKVSYSYNVMYNAFKRLSKGYSAAERADMFHDTAVRVYRIEV